ncbi:MAG TPA: uracil-DNA glycosylase [Chloroflexota bacterium]|nr:uracil-DNA glycosylase [Chloroflexota bacterium]
MSSAGAGAELERLCSEVENCTRCDLYRGTTHGVPGEGPADASIMLVGEAPGFNEDKQGRPFVGAAGKFLEELLAIAELKRSDVYITNVIKHRPPNNRDPLPGEIAACRPYLERQLTLIKPRLIITLGRFSLGTFFPGSMISKVHGELRQKEGRHFFAMYHPAAALHQDRLRQTLLDDMRKLARFLQSPAWQSGQTVGRSDEPEDEPEQLSLF